MGVYVGLSVNRVWNGRSDLQAGVEIYYWKYPGFRLILSSQNDPILGPKFSPPRVVNWRPHISTPHNKPGPNFKLCTQIYVPGHASYPVSHWPCPGRASHAWE